MRQSGGDMGQSVCSRTTQHECCLLQSTTKGQSEPDIHEEFDAYLHQLGSFDAYLCPSGRFMSQMTMTRTGCRTSRSTPPLLSLFWFSSPRPYPRPLTAHKIGATMELWSHLITRIM